MDARDRRAGRTGRGPARRSVAGLATAAILVAALAWGCGTQPVPSRTPAPTPTPAPTATPAPTPSPTPAYADTLRVGWGPSGWALCAFRGLYLACNWPFLSFPGVVYSGLYRYDAHWQAVPDLADGPCLVLGADRTVIRCPLIETTFHDGTPLTADDVAYTYDLYLQEANAGYMALGSLKEVRVVDTRTVDFVLSAVDPTFLTEVLPGIPIVPQHAVEASYADFVARTKGLTAKDLTKLADAIGEESARTPPVCSPRLAEVDALLAKLDAHLYREDFAGANEAFDPCAYMAEARDEISRVAAALGDTGLNAVMQAFMFFAVFRPPVGSGPYRYVSQTADRVHLEAWPGYHGGLAATKYLDFVPAKADGSDLEAGTLDVFQIADFDTATRATVAAHGVRVATPLGFGDLALAFNVRPGHLFADAALRRALRLCIDLPRDVYASTGGGGMAIYGPVIPDSWGDDPNIPRLPRDVATARKLIEGAGWQQGADGVYAKGKVRLAAKIVVRGDASDRAKMADLIALQARDCGMDLASLPKGWSEILDMLGNYPHDIPGTKTPFDLYIGGWFTGPDPSAGLGIYTSSNVSDAKHPDSPNFGGFTDPAFDQLIAAGAVSYDQTERTRIYRQAQEELAAQQPAVFLWTSFTYDAVRSAVTTVDGPLDFSVPNWSWQPERMVVAATGQ